MTNLDTLKEIADRSDKVNHPPGDWGRTGAAEKEEFTQRVSFIGSF